MSKQKRILALWDYNSFTGFATVSKNLMANFVANLGDSYKIDIVAVNYFGEDYNEGENVRVISAKMKDAAKDDFGRHVFMRSLIDVEYDLIFILQDLGVVVPMIKYMREIKEDKIKKKQKPFKSILYFPVDFELTPNLGVGLEFFDYLATYTEYGRKYTNAVNKNIAHKLNVIPHGNNPENFYPLEKSKALDFRKEYFGKNADKFIVTNVNRNQSRKDIPNTIFGFLEYWEEVNKNSFLYLHMDENDPMGWNLRTILNQTPLKEGIDYSFPPKGTMSKGASIQHMNGIMNSSDVFLTTTVGEGWGLCLHPSTMITTLLGAKPINEVKKGDKVLTHEGVYKEVIDTTSRTINSYIHVKCDYGFEVKATHEHPYLVKSGKETKWKKFQEISTNDYLAIVKPKSDKKIIETLDLSQFIDINDGWIIEEDFIYHKNGFSPKSRKWSISTIVKQYDTTKKIVENATSYLNGKLKSVSERSLNLVNRLINDGYNNYDTRVKINRWLKIDENILWLIGLYLADGSSDKGRRVEFSLNTTTKKAYADKVIEVCCNYFGLNLEDITSTERGNRLEVRISSVLIAAFFSKLCGKNAKSKKVPSIFIGSETSLMPLVYGYLNGDGSVNLKNDLIAFTTISPSLAFQIQSILNSNGIFIAIRHYKKRSKNLIYTCIIPSSHCRIYMDKVGLSGILHREGKRNHTPKFQEDDNYFFVKVKSISEVFETSDVYDLCVVDSHTFVGNGLVCHNTITEAMACKLPIIAPNHTSVGEICKAGERAYMLETLYPTVAMVDNVIRFQCDLYEISDTLSLVENHIKSKNPILQNKVEMAFEYVNTLGWEKISMEFIKAIRNLTK